MTTSADGYPLKIGDTVFVVGSDPRIIKQHKIGEILPNKIVYDTLDEDGYVGAKISCIFKHRKNAEQHQKSILHE